MLHVNASVDAEVEPVEIFSIVSDLGTYPDWLDIVGSAQAVPADPDDGGSPAWLIDLRAQMGPLRRSKRLRMERTVCKAPLSARFERRELDGRSHSDWVLTATIEELGETTRLTMDLLYAGSLWLPALDRILREEIRRSSARLVSLVEQRH
ncbi:MAG: SRPBCC family protein [Microthrixaceae bacterium]|nr:SRPBCC family protein [Microthrixaceae bacterium]